MTSVTLPEKNKIDVLQEKLYHANDRYVDTRKHNWEEIKKTYVLEQANNELENEIKLLKITARPVIEVINKSTQIEEVY